MKIDDTPLIGWCSPAKEKWLTSWIETHKPKVIAELGVYGGASLIPMAVAASSYPSKVYGIDPWDVDAALEGMVKPTNVEWWTRNIPPLTDVEVMCRNAVHRIGLTNVVLLRGRSDFYKDIFLDNEIDLLSIDGNHGPQALIDGKNYLPKVKPGGLIACDDEDWYEGGIPTVRNMIDWLVANGCNHLGIINDCAMLQKKAALPNDDEFPPPSVSPRTSEQTASVP